jgi:hypothetical protein
MGIVVLAFFGVVGCASYTIPVRSFDEQTRAVHRSDLRSRAIQVAYTGTRMFRVNGIGSVRVEDSDGKALSLPNSPALEVRFTLEDGSTSVMYFDSIWRNDSLVIGSQSRLMPIFDTVTIPRIRRIEIQDGHKNYRYVD